MIEIKDFSIGYKGKDLLNHVDSVFPDNKLNALIGRNGSGKSTLLKALCGINQYYKGVILINGDKIQDYSSLKLAKTVSFVNSQRPRISNMKCVDVVALGRTPYTGWSAKLSKKDYEIVYDSLTKVGMESFAERNLESLSDGECQKIMIARAIAQDTKIILLDEPTSFLDLPTRFEVVTLLKDLAVKQNKTIIFSTHELDIALKLSDYIALFDSKKLINLPVYEMKSSHILTSVFPLIDS